MDKIKGGSALKRATSFALQSNNKDTGQSSMNNATNMRGLTQYIADLRACRVRELEEKRINKEMAHIRQRFKEGNMTGYQKRKYVAKLLFTYILGYKVDIGHMEAVNLISSTKYSEKQMGYLALTLLLHENSDLTRLVINSIRKDLEDLNEVNNCLALHAIANLGGAEMAEALGEDVHRALISPTSSTFVKKKAALTLLRLYRKHPDVIPAAEWALRIVSVMDDDDLGVALATTSLVMTLAQDHLEAFSVCYAKAVNRLSKLVIDREFSADYIYYKVPIPWLQVKLLRLLQYYPPSEDPAVRLAIHNVLHEILEGAQDTPKNVQHANAQNAVLFEAINLAIHLDTESSIVHAAAVLLGKFILSKETNVRYLGLDTMAHLAACSDSLEPIKRHQDTIILSLRDKDISVRRRGLDLLYSMCDVTNAKVIVGELLRYLSVADYGLREEMVLKIAILTEKFATEYQWYVDTILQLIQSAGEHVGDEVWYRVVQIVTNTEDLQQYAAQTVYEHLRNPTCPENLVKVGGYILGEYGHLIADNPGCSPIEQFHVLHSKSNFSSAQTRALLLSTYLKWVNLFPEIKPQLVSVFDRYRHVLDAELQQRASEYLAISTRDDDDALLQTLCEEMPPFPERESALLNRLHRKHGDTQDQRTWVIGGKEANRDRELARLKSLKKAEGGILGGGVAAMATGTGAAAAAVPPRAAVNGNGNVPVDDLLGSGDIMSSLSGLDLSSPPAQPLASPPPNLFPEPITTSTSPPSSSLSATAPIRNAAVDSAYDRLCYTYEGVLYESDFLSISLKSEYHGQLGRLALVFRNKISSAAFTSFSATIDVPQASALAVTFPQMTSSTIDAGGSLQQPVHVECKDIFDETPILRVSYLAGSHQTLALRLPIILSKFIEPVQLGQSDFFERWRQIGGPPREAQAIFPIALDAAGEVDVAAHGRIVSGHRLGLLDGIDPNPVNNVGAGVLHTSAAGKVGCLLRLEPNKDAKLCRLTVRTTNEDVSSRLLQLLQRLLTA